MSEKHPLPPCPDSPNCVSTFATDRQHAIDPIRYDGDRKAALRRMKRVLQQHRKATLKEEREDYLRAVFRAFVFKDDVEFYFPSDESVIHFRSASRTGYSDLGANRRRMEQLRRLFAQEKV